jgi:hypothetical protein
VIRCVLLYLLEAVDGKLCLPEVLQVPEVTVMCCSVCFVRVAVFTQMRTDHLTHVSGGLR